MFSTARLFLALFALTLFAAPSAQAETGCDQARKEVWIALVRNYNVPSDAATGKVYGGSGGKKMSCAKAVLLALILNQSRNPDRKLPENLEKGVTRDPSLVLTLEDAPVLDVAPVLDGQDVGAPEPSELPETFTGDPQVDDEMLNDPEIIEFMDWLSTLTARSG